MPNVMVALPNIGGALCSTPDRRKVWLTPTTRCRAGFTAFSLPGQFAPRGESANRTLANSLPGTFAPWPIRPPWPSRSLEPSLSGPFAPWPSRYSINRIIFAALAYSLYRPMT